MSLVDDGVKSVQRMALLVQYDGTEYCGFQRQTSDPSIQATLEKALSQLAKKPIQIVGAGRNDAGVHAHGQVIHFDTDWGVPEERIVPAVNGVLPRDIRVRRAAMVCRDFHARYSAINKTYRYQIWQGPYADVFWRRTALWERDVLDWDAWQLAAKQVIGRHDFAGFAAVGSSVKTTVRTLESIEVRQTGSLTQVTFTADGFLYNMVRNLVGTLLAIAKGRRPVSDMSRILVAKDRSLAGATAPAHGLTLLQVRYGPNLVLDTDPGVQ